LDNLLLLYPAEPRIVAKCEELQAQRPATGDDEIAQVIERIAAGAAPPDSEDAASADRVLPVFDLGSKAVAREKDGKVSAADLFAGIDLVPFVAPEEPPPAGAFLDLDDKIAEEIEAIGAVFARQFQDRASVIEKDLTDIVQDFRRQVEAKLDKQNTETRQSLGQAFLEQGLYDEAIEEFKLAAADPERAADCAGLIARALVKKGLPAEAEVWLRQGRDKTSPGSTEYFALTYDLAQLLETLDRNADALALFKEVSGWNAKFRDVGKRIRILQKTVSA
jgi:tetratricopeptide (TPR) repeat protein